jgi:hypothetical protein
MNFLLISKLKMARHISIPPPPVIFLQPLREKHENTLLQAHMWVL